MTSLGSISYTYPVCITLALSLIVAGIGFYRGKFLDVAPTLSWAIFMQLPFILQSGFYFPGSVSIQAYGIAIVGFFVSLGDFLSVRSKGLQAGQELPRNANALLVVCLICLIYFPIYHLTHVNIEQIPLVGRLWGGLDGIEISERRELFGKGLEVNPIYKYAFQWVCTIFGPLAFAILFRKKSYLLAALVCVWVGLYAILSTATLPILLFVIFAALGVSSRLPPTWGRCIGVLIFSLWFGFALSGVVRIGEISNWIEINAKSDKAMIEYGGSEVASDQYRQLTLNDVERVDGVMIPGIYGKKYNGLVYRAFLSPVDVSNQWYTYFKFKARQKRALNDLVGVLDSREPKASSRVGRWAYVERFPSHYLPSINAYGSIDADAFSFGGVVGVIFVGVIYLLARLYSIWLAYRPMGSLITPIMVGFFALFLIQSSLQAIVFSQGLFILIIAGLIHSRKKINFGAEV